MNCLTENCQKKQFLTFSKEGTEAPFLASLHFWAMTHYKLVVLGAGAVGKSAITTQFVQGCFVCEYDPTIEDTYARSLAIDNENVRLEILDTVGQGDFPPLRTYQIKQGQGFLIVYAIDDRASLEEVEVFHRDVLTRKGVTNVPLVICGNKCDREDKRVVSEIEGKELAQRLNAKFFETSALANIHIEDAFRTLVLEIRQSDPPSQPPKENESTYRKKGGRKRCVLV